MRVLGEQHLDQQGCHHLLMIWMLWKLLLIQVNLMLIFWPLPQFSSLVQVSEILTDEEAASGR